ncbi:MAG: hypothetical protein AAGF88_08215 [Pseudomonadota bacterium]
MRGIVAGGALLCVIAQAASAQVDGVTARCMADGTPEDICLCATVIITETETSDDIAIFSAHGQVARELISGGAGSLAVAEGSLHDTANMFEMEMEDVRGVIGRLTGAQTLAIETCTTQAEAEAAAQGG